MGDGWEEGGSLNSRALLHMPAESQKHLHASDSLWQVLAQAPLRGIGKRAREFGRLMALIMIILLDISIVHVAATDATRAACALCQSCIRQPWSVAR